LGLDLSRLKPLTSFLFLLHPVSVLHMLGLISNVTKWNFRYRWSHSETLCQLFWEFVANWRIFLYWWEFGVLYELSMWTFFRDLCVLSIVQRIRWFRYELELADTGIQSVVFSWNRSELVIVGRNRPISRLKSVDPGRFHSDFGQFEHNYCQIETNLALSYL